MTTRGVDISKYNGNCDFNRAKKAGLDFVIIKAGSGASGEDPYWVKHYNGAKSAGMGVGAYWYCYATNVEQARKEAQMFLKCLEGMQFDYPVYLDLEDKCQASLGNKIRTDIAVAFMEVLERAGYHTGIYSMKAWFDKSFDMERLKGYDLWIARWGSSEHGYVGKGSIGMWQYTNAGRYDGIGNTSEGGVDTNIAYRDYPKIIKSHGLNNFKKQDNNNQSTSNNPSSEADKVLGYMRAWIGKSEANGQHKDIIDIYNNHKPLPQNYKVKYTDEWCATTVSAAVISAGLLDKVGKECSVQRYIDIFKSKGIWIEDGSIRPEPGDIICFAWSKSTQPNDNWANHIGFVETVSGNTITTIEGNNDEAVKRRNIQVGSGYIRGYARPKYAGQDSSKKTGWVKENNHWYFYENGKKKTGWLEDKNGKWFYLQPDKDGMMLEGWLEYNKAWYFFGEGGYEAFGWVKYNNKWFYFNPDDGKMVTGKKTIDGKTYEFDSKGYWVK